MATKILEKQIQRSILDYLMLKGHYVWRNNTGTMKGDHKGKRWFMRFGLKGSSDILGVRKDANGQFLAIEVKRPGNRITEDQATFICAVQELGGMAFVAYSLEDVIKRGL